MEQMSKYLEEKYSYLSEDKRKNNRSVVLYSPFFNKEKISWWEYIKAYNSGEFFIDSQYDKYLVIGWLIFFPGFYGYLAISLSLHLLCTLLRIGKEEYCIAMAWEKCV